MEICNGMLLMFLCRKQSHLVFIYFYLFSYGKTFSLIEMTEICGYVYRKDRLNIGCTVVSSDTTFRKYNFPFNVTSFLSRKTVKYPSDMTPPPPFNVKCNLYIMASANDPLIIGLFIPHSIKLRWGYMASIGYLVINPRYVS